MSSVKLVKSLGTKTGINIALKCAHQHQACLPWGKEKKVSLNLNNSGFICDAVSIMSGRKWNEQKSETERLLAF